MVRSTAPKPFYRDQHDAAADVQARVRSWTGDLAGGDALVLGSTGWGAVRTTTDQDPLGTLVEFATKAVSNIVITNTEDAVSTDLLLAGESLATCLAGSGYGVASLLPRSPRYTSADENQLVVLNPNVGAVGATITWEETAKPGFLNGGHPGNGVITLPLGSILPTAYAAGTSPIRFRLAPGTGFIVTAAKVRSVVRIASAGDAVISLVRSDAAVLNTATINLETMAAGTLNAFTLEAAAAARTISGAQYLDIVITLDDFTGTAGDVTVELEVTRT